LLLHITVKDWRLIENVISVAVWIHVHWSRQWPTSICHGL